MQETLVTKETAAIHGAGTPQKRPSLTKFAWLSIAAALATIALKVTAYYITDSVGLLSDAAESLVNLVAAVMALILIAISERPPDEEHAYGHSKAEYFSSAVEGVLILVAAVAIAYAAILRLINPQPLESIGLGLVVSTVASAINFAVAIVLRRAGKKYRSIALEADSAHLMTDVWTSVGVIVGVALVGLTGWLRLDPIIALVVAANIVWSGVHLLRRSTSGLMDTSLSTDDVAAVETVLAPYRAQGVGFHAVRTRQAGTRRFVSLHVLLPGQWSIQRGHELLEEIEARIRTVLPGVVVFTHMEPLGDPSAMEDQTLDRA
jgi:cation diffusion facilitator family transporter